MNLESLTTSFGKWVIRWRWLILLLVILITGGLYAFHNLVMDLDTLWNKISMRLERLV